MPGLAVLDGTPSGSASREFSCLTEFGRDAMAFHGKGQGMHARRFRLRAGSLENTDVVLFAFAYME